MFTSNKNFGWFFIVIGVLTLSFLLIQCSKQGSEVVTIGAVLPLTGSGAIWGQNAKKGIDLALDEINSGGGVKGRKLEVIYEDSESLPKSAVSALRKLINAHHVHATITDIASSNVLAMAPIAESNKVVMLSPGASSPEITNAGEYTFRNWPSDALQGIYSAKIAYDKLKFRKVAIIYVNNAYGVGLKDVFTKEFNKLGGEVLITEAFKQEDTDYRMQLTKIKNIESDGIYIPGYPKEMALLLKQSKELGITKQILATEAFEDPKILEVAGDAAEGVIYSYPKPADPKERIVGEFINNYKKHYAEEPGICSDTGYDAIRILAWAMEESGFTGPEIQKQLLKLKDFPGAAGLTTFDENGDAQKPFIFKTVKNGTFVNYTPQELE
jgi:branched-chain amino acid transport system substrate-binding protein